MIPENIAATRLLTEPVTVNTYLAWAEEQVSGRYELVHGKVIAMAPERVRHGATKGEAYVALRNAVRRSELDCTVLPDGMTVVIDEHTAYEPDVVMQCGDRPDPDSVIVDAPTVIIEVLSPSTKHVDLSGKLADYFKIGSVRHYLILHPDQYYVIHHRRVEDGISTHILRDGEFTLDPPGLQLSVNDLFPEAGRGGSRK